MATKGLLMARVSSKEQAEGFSLQAQERLGTKYAEHKQIELVRTWSVVESAKKEGRIAFNEMISLAKKDQGIKCLLFEKPDRMSRNLFDLIKIYELVEKYGKEVHFFRINLVINKDSSPDDFMRMDIDVVIARAFIHRLRQETMKGLLEKAEEGNFPGLAPCGYLNNKETKVIDKFAPEESPWVKRAFELMRTRLYSLEGCRQQLLKEGCPDRLLRWKSCLEKWLRNPFYYGAFMWKGKLYKGNHPPLVSKELWDEANAVLSRYGKAMRKREFTFGGLMSCANCGCSITAELHKEKYPYYRCTWRKGKCGNNSYYSEKAMDGKMQKVVEAVHIPEEVAQWAMEIISLNSSEITAQKEMQQAQLKQEIKRLETRLGNAYADKADGRISEAFWSEQSSKWQAEQIRLESALQRLKLASPATYVPLARNVLELSKCLPALYNSMEGPKKRYLLSLLCLNLKFDGETIIPDYREPFTFVVNAKQQQNWGG